MILPLVPAAVGARARRPLAGALLCLLLLVLSFAAARAQSDDPYTVTVKVDATADNVVKARDKARLDGQRKALAEIADNLAGGPGKGKLPKLDDNAITDMVVSFEVASERMTTVRYSADYTYHFRPADVQKALHLSAGAAPSAPAAAGAAAKPALVLPLYQVGTKVVLWDDPNPWRDAWSERDGTDHLIVPLGDVTDLAAIDADKARSGDSDALVAIAKKYGTDDALVALAALRGPAAMPAGLDIAVKRYRAGQFVDAHGQSLDANPGESTADFFRRAAQATAAAIDGNWRGIPAQNDQQGSLTVAVAINGLDDWVKLRDRIAGLPAVHKIELRALSRQEATIELGYVGDVGQLTAALKGLDLDLVKGDPAWHLSRSGTPGAATAPVSPAPPDFPPPSVSPAPPAGPGR